MATTLVLHRLASTVPILAEVQKERHWVQVSRKVIVASGIAFILFTVGYSAFVFESVLLTIGSPLIIFAAASAFWHICDEQLIQLSQDLEIAEIFVKITEKPQQKQSYHLILDARYQYFEERYKKFIAGFDQLDRSVSAAKLQNTTKEKFENFDLEIFNNEKQAALAKIKMAWIQILIDNPYFQGELSDLCSIPGDKTYEKHCRDKKLEARTPSSTDFLRFTDTREAALKIEDILILDVQELKKKLLPLNNLPRPSPTARRRSLPNLHKRSNTHHTLTGPQTLPASMPQAQ